MKFDNRLTKIDFLPNIVDFPSSEPLTEQTCDARLETWYDHSWGPMENYENYLIPLKLNIPWEIPNPSCVPVA